MPKCEECKYHKNCKDLRYNSNVDCKRFYPKSTMVKITINFPELYDKNIQKLIKQQILPNRSSAIRLALKEFLQREYTETLELFGFFGDNE